MHEVWSYVESSATDDAAAGTQEYGPDDSLVLSGGYFRRRIMCSLVAALVAPGTTDGIVLVGSRHARQVCGWFGPALAPTGTPPH